VHDYDPVQGLVDVTPEAPGGLRLSRDDVAGGDVAQFSSNLFSDATIRFIDADHGDEPFLLFVAFTAPHDPRTPPPGWEVDPESVTLTSNFLPEHPFDNGEMTVRDELLAGTPRGTDEVRQHIADYYGMIAHLDYSVGRIVEAVAANGLADDTVVIYTGDHGLAVGQHGLMGKQNVYEHSLRIPLVMAGPGIPAGGIHDGLVWHGDTTATIRHLAEVAADPLADGASLIGEGEVQSGREEFGAAYEYCQRMYRDARYKLIVYRAAPDGVKRAGGTPGCDLVQLFDLRGDPWETVNLADDPAHAEIRARLARGLRAWQVAVGDVFPLAR
jgi:arylsulfatase A-like enzyme